MKDDVSSLTSDPPPGEYGYRIMDPSADASRFKLCDPEFSEATSKEKEALRFSNILPR